MYKTELNKISISNIQKTKNNSQNKKVLDIIQKNIILPMKNKVMLNI